MSMIMRSLLADRRGAEGRRGDGGRRRGGSDRRPESPRARRRADSVCEVDVHAIDQQVIDQQVADQRVIDDDGIDSERWTSREASGRARNATGSSAISDRTDPRIMGRTCSADRFYRRVDE
jgi:hypothetical protein